MKDNNLESADYRSPLSVKKVILIVTISFLLGIMVTFPLRTILRNKIIDLLPQLSVSSVEKVDLSFVLPRLSLHTLQLNQPIEKIKRIDIKFRGFSLSPLGLKLAVNVQLVDDWIEGRVVLAYQRVDLKIKSNLSLAQLKESSSLLDFLNGKLNINFALSWNLKNNKWNSLSLQLHSSDLEILSKMIFFVQIPQIAIGPVNIDLVNQGDDLLVKNLECGEMTKDLYIKSMGKIANFSDFNIWNGQLDIKNKLYLAKPLLEEIPLYLFLPGVVSVKDIYGMHITGSFSSPTITNWVDE